MSGLVAIKNPINLGNECILFCEVTNYSGHKLYSHSTLSNALVAQIRVQVEHTKLLFVVM